MFSPDATEDAAQLKPLGDRLLASTCRPPLYGPHATGINHNRHIGYCVYELNTHHHTYTCSKNGFKGGDDDCRMNYPRELVPEMTITPEGYVAVARDDPMTVPYVPAMFLAEPCNHAVYFMCEAGDHLRAVAQWEKKKEAKQTEAACPAAVPLNVAAARRAEYSSKYNTKSDNIAINAKFISITQHLDKVAADLSTGQGAAPPPDTTPGAGAGGRGAGGPPRPGRPARPPPPPAPPPPPPPPPPPTTTTTPLQPQHPSGETAPRDPMAPVANDDDGRRAAKRAVAKVVNRVNGTVMYSAPLAACYLLYNEDSRCSHGFRMYNHIAFTDHLLNRTGHTHLVRNADTSGSLVRGRRTAEFVSTVTDYHYRSHLSSLSPYIVNMKFVKCRSDAPNEAANGER